MMVDLLLKHGARDDDCKALAVAVQNKDETLTAKLLSTKVTFLHKFYCIVIGDNYFRRILIQNIK